MIVDVFTDTPLQGNQLAVFEDGSALSDDQMQRLARKMKVSETVFLLPAEDGDARRCRTTNGGYAAAILRWVRGWCPDKGTEPPGAAVGLPPASPLITSVP